MLFRSGIRIRMQFAKLILKKTQFMSHPHVMVAVRDVEIDAGTKPEKIVGETREKLINRAIGGGVALAFQIVFQGFADLARDTLAGTAPT